MKTKIPTYHLSSKKDDHITGNSTLKHTICFSLQGGNISQFALILFFPATKQNKTFDNDTNSASQSRNFLLKPRGPDTLGLQATLKIFPSIVIVSNIFPFLMKNLNRVSQSLFLNILSVTFFKACRQHFLTQPLQLQSATSSIALSAY